MLQIDKSVQVPEDVKPDFEVSRDVETESGEADMLRILAPKRLIAEKEWLLQ